MNTQFMHHTELIQYISNSTWKEKINFYVLLTEDIYGERLQISPKILEQSWVELLNENNVNILLKVVNCLNYYTKHYSIQSLKVQRQIIKKLLGLTKMKKQQIDERVVDIICSLISKEKEAESDHQRIPFGLLSSLHFSSINNPTFLFGTSDEGVEDEESQTQINQHSSNKSISYLLQVLIEIMKGCRKEVFHLLLNVANRLAQGHILNENEIQSLSNEIECVKDVLLNRRNALSTENKELEVAIELVLQRIRDSV